MFTLEGFWRLFFGVEWSLALSAGIYVDHGLCAGMVLRDTYARLVYAKRTFFPLLCSSFYYYDTKCTSDAQIAPQLSVTSAQQYDLSPV